MAIVENGVFGFLLPLTVCDPVMQFGTLNCPLLSLFQMTIKVLTSLSHKNSIY